MPKIRRSGSHESFEDVFIDVFLLKKVYQMFEKSMGKRSGCTPGDTGSPSPIPSISAMLIVQHVAAHCREEEFTPFG